MILSTNPKVMKTATLVAVTAALFGTAASQTPTVDQRESIISALVLPAEEKEVPAGIAAPEHVDSAAAVAVEVAPPPPPEPPATPLRDNRVTNDYGIRYGVNPLLPANYPEFHNGLDLGAAQGTPIHSWDQGTVVYAEYHQYGGLRTIIDHGNGRQTTYSHQDAQWVQVGDHVEADQIIGSVGTTGNSTAPHLHFEMFQDGTEIDPTPYLIGAHY